MYIILFPRLSGRSPFLENDPQETEARIQGAKFDLSKLYQNVSQSASLFLKKILCSYPWYIEHQIFDIHQVLQQDKLLTSYKQANYPVYRNYVCGKIDSEIILKFFIVMVLAPIFHRARPSIKDCFNNSWLQDAYLMRLRRQTLTFTTTRLKEFLAEQQRRREEVATKHKVLLRSYQSSPQTPTSPATPNVPTLATTPVTQ